MLRTLHSVCLFLVLISLESGFGYSGSAGIGRDNAVYKNTISNSLDANSDSTTEASGVTGGNVTEMSRRKAEEIQIAKKYVEIGWKRAIEATANPLDCCSDGTVADCSNTCDMNIAECSLQCGSLIMPEQPTPGTILTTKLVAPSGGIVWVRVAFTDLRKNDQISAFSTPGDTVSGPITCESFTKEKQEIYFASDAEELYVVHETTITTTITPITNKDATSGCSVWEEPTKKLAFRSVGKATCHIDIIGDEDDLFGEIVSPGYPDEPYPPNRECSWTITAPSKGYGVDIFINELDLDGVFDDYVRIISGDYSLTNEARGGYFLTWTNSESQNHLKVFPGGSATIYFYAGRHSAPTVHKGFQIEYRKYGNGSIPEDSTTADPTLPTPPEDQSVNASIYVAGKSPEMFNKEKDDFRAALSLVANHFCDEKNITLLESIRFQDVHIHSIRHCPTTWPFSDKCAEAIIQIVAKTLSNEYELTDVHIQQMWNIYGFDNNITSTGVRRYQQQPDVIIWWLVVMVGALVAFVLFLMSAWCVQTRIAYKNYASQARKSNEEIEIKENKKEVNAFEYSSHTLPPFKVLEEEEEDDNSFTNDHRDSYYDYDCFGSAGGSAYYSYNDDIVTSITGEKINHAFIPDDEDDEVEEIDIGREDFKFQFTSTNGRRLSQNQPYEFPAHQRVLNIEGSTDDKLSETVL